MAITDKLATLPEGWFWETSLATDGGDMRVCVFVPDSMLKGGFESCLTALPPPDASTQTRKSTR